MNFYYCYLLIYIIYVVLIYLYLWSRDEQNGSEYGSRGRSKGDSNRLRHCKMIGLYKRTDIQCPSRCGSQEKFNNNNMHVRIVENSGNKCNPSRSIDNFNLNPRPTSDQRYNFYRYYGKNLFHCAFFMV